VGRGGGGKSFDARYVSGGVALREKNMDNVILYSEGRRRQDLSSVLVLLELLKWKRSKGGEERPY